MDVGSVMVSVRADLRSFSGDLRAALGDLNRATGRMGNDVDDLADQTGDATKRMTGYFKDVSRIVSGILISQAFYGALQSIQQATSALFEFSMTLEDAAVKYEMLLGSTQEAKGFMSALEDFATNTPFDFQGLDRAAQRVKLMGVETKNVLPILRTVGDAISIMGGDTDTLDRLTVAMRQMYQSPKAQAEELEQFIEAGIDVSKYLREELGLTAEQIKNIGDESISGSVAVNAILQGLSKDARFSGGMEKLSENTRGMIESIKDASKFLGVGMFSNIFAGMKDTIRSIRDEMEGLKEAFDLGGNGAVFEKLIPPELQPAIRTIIGSFRSLWDSIKMIASALAPVAQAFGGALLGALAVLAPIVATLARAIAFLTQWMLQNEPVVKALTYAIIGLNIAGLVSRSILMLVTAIRALSIAAVVAQAVNLLRNSIIKLTGAMTKNPIVAVVTIIIAVLLALALSSKTAQKWIESLMARLSQLAGFDMGDILSPEDSSKELEDFSDQYNGALEDISKGMEGVNDTVKDNGGALKDSTKEAKKFIAAFDEVFQVPEPELDKKDDGKGPGSGLGDELDDMKPIKLPPFKMPEIPPLPPLSDLLPDFPTDIVLPRLAWPMKWSTVLEPLQKFSLEFKTWLQNLPVAAGHWIPQLELELKRVPKIVSDWLKELQGVIGGLPNYGFGDALSSVRGWVNDVVESLNGLTPRVLPQWQGTWTSIPTVVSTALSAAGAGIASFGASALSGWNTTWGTIGVTVANTMASIGATIASNIPSWSTGIAAALASIGVTWNTSWSGFQTAAAAALAGIGADIAKYAPGWKTAIMTALASISISFADLKKTITLTMIGLWAGIQISAHNFGTTFMEVIKGALSAIAGFWEAHKWKVLAVVGTLVAAVLLYFLGVPTAILAAIGALLMRLGPLLMRIGPLFMTAIKGVPKLFNSVFSKLPTSAQTFITSIVNAFKKLPNQVWEAIKKIPSMISKLFKDIKLPDFSGMAGKVVGAFSGGPQMTGFASGGIINKDSIVRVGEGGRREAIIPLQNGEAMRPFADAVAAQVASQMPRQADNNSGGGQTQQVIHVGTLIADERSLRDLERRMQVIRKNESLRGVTT